MFLFSLLLASLSFTCLYTEGQASCPQCKKILDDKIPSDDHRYDSFLMALNLLTHRKASVIVETGTARGGLNNCLGDGCSTIIFAEWIKENGGEFYSVDINEENLQKAAEALDDITFCVNLVHSDSVEFLQKFNRSIDFLYLDSYDFDFNDPEPSQQHHLKEIIAAYPYLTQNSIVMIDDCDLPYGGKGKFVIEFLLDKGWGILINGYQVILVRP